MMTIIRKTISLTPEQDAWVKSKVASGEFASDSEVHRAIIKAHQNQEKKRDQLYDMLQAGLNSGTSDRSFDEIVKAARARAKAELEKRHKGAA